MNLTESQNAAIAQARADGRQRIMSEFTPEQRADWEKHVALALAEKDQIIASFRKQNAAAKEPGFSGDLRRAIAASGKGPLLLAAELGVDPDQMESFCEGESELPLRVIDQLVEYLGLKLVQLI